MLLYQPSVSEGIDSNVLCKRTNSSESIFHTEVLDLDFHRGGGDVTVLADQVGDEAGNVGSGLRGSPLDDAMTK
jgi:hypothetical protein